MSADSTEVTLTRWVILRHDPFPDPPNIRSEIIGNVRWSHADDFHGGNGEAPEYVVWFSGKLAHGAREFSRVYR